MKNRLSLLALLACLFLSPTAQAGLFDDDEARRRIEQMRQDVEQRLEKVEASNAVVLNNQKTQAAQLETLRQDLARLLGQVDRGLAARILPLGKGLKSDHHRPALERRVPGRDQVGDPLGRRGVGQAGQDFVRPAGVGRVFGGPGERDDRAGNQLRERRLETPQRCGRGQTRGGISRLAHLPALHHLAVAVEEREQQR
mgnify:CR=1 FL=1